MLHFCSSAVIRSIPGEALLAKAWSETECWQKLLVGKPKLLKGKELAEFTLRLGPKLVSQNRKCECIVEWKGRNENRHCKPDFMGIRRKCSKELKMDLGKLIRRHYLKEMLVG